MGRKGVWTPAQSAQFLRHRQDSRLFAAWALAVVAGMRRGELAGLKWDRVDLDRGVLLVSWQRTTTSNQVIEKAPKGKSRHAADLMDTALLNAALLCPVRFARGRSDALGRDGAALL